MAWIPRALLQVCQRQPGHPRSPNEQTRRWHVRVYGEGGSTYDLRYIWPESCQKQWPHWWIDWYLYDSDQIYRYHHYTSTIHPLPSGKSLQYYGKPTFLMGNSLFLWPCSIAMLTQPEGISINIPVLSHDHLYKTIGKTIVNQYWNHSKPLKKTSQTIVNHS